MDTKSRNYFKKRFSDHQSLDTSHKKRFLFFLKTLILLSPLPFGCVGKIWSPLFYVMLLLLTFLGLKVIEVQYKRLGAGSWGPGADNGFKVQGSRFNVEDEKKIIYEKWIKGLFIGYLVFIGMQIIPLPVFLVKLISPKKIEILSQLMDEMPAFTPVSIVPFDTLIFGLIVLLYGLFFMVIHKIKLRKQEIVSLFNTLILSASIQVIFGLFKLAQGNKMFFLFFYPVEKSEISKFLTGTLGNANHFAFFLEMVIPLGLGLFFYRMSFFDVDVSFRQRLLSITDENKIIMVYFIAISLMGIGIILTGSRSGIVTMILSFIVFAMLSVYLKQSKDIRKRIKWFLVAIICLAIYIGVQNTVTKFAQLEIVESGRFVRWPNTFEMVKDYPMLGTGFGTYRYSYFLYDTGPSKWSTHAHNDLLEILAEGGVMGSGLFYALIGLVIVSIIRKWNRRHHPDVKILGLGIMVSIFAVIFHSFFDFSLRIPSNMLVFVLVIVLGLKIVHYKSRDLSK